MNTFPDQPPADNDEQPLEDLIPDNDEQPEEGRSFRAKAWKTVRDVAETLVMAAVIWAVANLLTVRVMVTQASMQPNLLEGQHLIVSRLAYTFTDPRRGDIVVFSRPDSPRGFYLVKRIVGLPGETITVSQGGAVLINGHPLDEPYATIIDLPGNLTTREWTVPEGSYFVLGDNRRGSIDSRSWGFLGRDEIVGRAWFSYWPPKAIHFVRHYKYEDAGIP